jgi:hypothetical protein
LTREFDYFVVFAGMRTGSNYLERNLNAVPDVKSYGELFNPYFIAHEGEETYLGMTLQEREAAPMELVARARADTPALAGFRLFHDHDPRVREIALADPRCAKIILTRNPLESYISYRTALDSNQWVLTDAKGQVEVPPLSFDTDEFRDFAEAQARFLNTLRKGLAEAGQTALQIDFKDLADIEVLNGALDYLGSAHRLDRPERSLKRQNPQDTLDRVANPSDMHAALAALDPFDLDPTVAARLERGPAVRSYIAARTTPLLYLPLHGTFSPAVAAWMAALDGGSAPASGLTQKDLRDWRSAHPQARTFSILVHPVRRAWDAFESVVLPTDFQAYAEIRQGLIHGYKVPLPERWPDPDLPKGQLRRAFIAFCKFLKANLAGQTSLRIDSAWIGQHTLLHGMSAIAVADMLYREADLPEALETLSTHVGDQPIAAFCNSLPACPAGLTAVYDEKVETAVRAAYPRDYAVFGFGDWRAP